MDKKIRDIILAITFDCECEAIDRVRTELPNYSKEFGEDVVSAAEMYLSSPLDFLGDNIIEQNSSYIEFSWNELYFRKDAWGNWFVKSCREDTEE